MFNNSSIRRLNESHILELIVKHNEISRAELSKISGLTKSTITEITKNFLNKALIIETRAGHSSALGGRKPILLRLNAYAGIFISILLEPNTLHVCCALMNSEIVYSYSKPIILSEESLIALVDDVVNEISIHAPLTIEGVCSMTISIHGIVYNNKIVFALDYDVINETTLNDLTHRYSFPIHFSNEANMSALAEYSYIYNNSPNSIVSLNIHEKVNTGVICHNKILHGSRGFSGEYGHNILYPNGKKCECGNKGCVEAYCSEKALLEEYCIAKNIDSASLKMLSSDFYIKDPTSEKILQGFCFNIAIVINNIATSIDPDLIILNGPIFDEFPTIFSVIEEELNQILSSEINMKKSTLKDNSVLKGGIINSIMCYLNIANFYFD